VHFRFWGVRGSIPTPGEKTLRYGGNTTCIEVRGDDNELIVLDGGTGIFQLAQTLFAEFPLKVNIFITHTHWDHIQGLPMFVPIFVPGNQVTIHGAADIVNQRGVRDVLSRQMEYAYFPVREAELKAKMAYVDLQPPAQQVEIGSARVSCLLMNHPVFNFGYRVECNGKTLVFTGDHEWDLNIYDPQDAEYADMQSVIDEKRAAIINFFRGADALIIDTAYTDEEYPMRKGWGHGTFDSSIRAAREAEVKSAYLTHHEPTRSDDALEKAFAEALQRNQVGEGDPRFALAREGLRVEL
jgi:phosphoribosyl 1,2-cyclic phosphodiesterase